MCTKNDYILAYSDIMKLEVLDCTENPTKLLNKVLDATIKGQTSNDRIIKTIQKGHTSFLEFIDITFLVAPVTKSLIGQLTRHRMASYMSSSYHYSDATEDYYVFPDVNNIMNPDVNNIMNPDVNTYLKVHEFLRSGYLLYKELREFMPKEEARNILPVSMAHTMIFKMNARALLNFFNLRLCKRNIAEMIVLARKMQTACLEWCNPVFKFSGPDCLVDVCKQGSMRCEKEA